MNTKLTQVMADLSPLLRIASLPTPSTAPARRDSTALVLETTSARLSAYMTLILRMGRRGSERRIENWRFGEHIRDSDCINSCEHETGGQSLYTVFLIYEMTLIPIERCHLQSHVANPC